MRSHNNSPDLVEQYLEDVLNYYRTATSPSFAAWPTEIIGWVEFTANKKFYDTVQNWFYERGISVLKHNRTRRYLSTFILAAEFPPALGFEKHIIKLIQRNGWNFLNKDPNFCLQDYIETVNTEYLTVAEKQFLKKDYGDGYTAFLELLKILSKIRFLLGKMETLEEICIKVASENEYRIELILRIATTYKHILIPELEANKPQFLSPRYEYYLEFKGGGVSLKIKHNLNKQVQIPLSGSIELNRFSLASATAVSPTGILPIFTASDSISLEVVGTSIHVDFGLRSEFFTVSERNIGLKDVTFRLIVKNKHNDSAILNIGGIRRKEDFLIFDQTGKEIINNQRLFKKGETLYFVPLTTDMGKSFASSPHFQQKDYIEIPVFSIIGDPEEIQINGVVFRFCDFPFIIESREQTPWETAFQKSRTTDTYFFSPDMIFSLKGEIEQAPEPTIEFIQIVKTAGRIIQKPIPISYNEGSIKPKIPLSEPGQFKLLVRFSKTSYQTKTVRLLPVRSVRMLHEKKIQLRLFKPPIEDIVFPEGSVISSYKQVGEKVDLEVKEYGKHTIRARYAYPSRIISGREVKYRTKLEFTFKAQQEVVGYFSKPITGTLNEYLSLKKDLTPASYLEFRRNTLRGSTDPYTVVAYLEGDNTKGVLPMERRYLVVWGEEAFSLSDLESFVSRHAFTRLLLLVLHNNEELLRVEFKDERREIIFLESEWRQGLYHQLAVVPIVTAEKQYVDDISEIPLHSIIYGVQENRDEEKTIVTHGYAYIPEYYSARTPIEKLLFRLCEDTPVNREEQLRLLKPIFENHNQALQFVKWFTMASKWKYSNDIIPFVKLIQEFPALAVWADLARLTENKESSIPLIEKEAQVLKCIDQYYIPNVRNLTAFPMFLPERISLDDFRLLDEMNIMIGMEEGLMSTVLFYMSPFSERGKPAMSWVTLFWLKYITTKAGIVESLKENWPTYINTISSPFLKNMHEFSEASIPKYGDDYLSEQDISKIFYEEQAHYENPILNSIPTLHQFFEMLETSSFITYFSKLFDATPLIMASPYLGKFKYSTKWKCIIFLSLYAVSRQIENESLLNRMKDLYELGEQEYSYLIHWIGSKVETSHIYNAYYAYWMKLFWEEWGV